MLQITAEADKITKSFKCNPMQLDFYTDFAVFKIEICGAFFKRNLQENEDLHMPTFHMKINHFIIVFHMT